MESIVLPFRNGDFVVDDALSFLPLTEIAICASREKDLALMCLPVALAQTSVTLVPLATLDCAYQEEREYEQYRGRRPTHRAENLFDSRAQGHDRL